MWNTTIVSTQDTILNLKTVEKQTVVHYDLHC